MLTQLKTDPSIVSQQKPAMSQMVSTTQSSLNSTDSSTSKQVVPILKQKNHLPTFFLLFILLFVLVGGVAVALYLTSQRQEVRQQAEVTVSPTPVPFTYFPPSSGASVLQRTTNPANPPETMRVSIDFNGSPSCTENACQASMKFTPDQASIPSGCRLNTANVVYYNLQTNSSDPNYPDNVSLPSGGSNANCNRPLRDCSNGSDPNCVLGTQVASPPPTSQCSGGAMGCTYFQIDLPITLRTLDLNCGCSQFDVSVAEITLLCANDTQVVKYEKPTTDTSIGAYAYGYSTAQCAGPTATPTNVPGATNTPVPTATPTNVPGATATPPGSRPTATPTLTTVPTQTPTPPPGTTVTPQPTSSPTPRVTATPAPSPTPAPFGEMCVSISSNPIQPKFGDSVTFTCGLVKGISSYQFRYMKPGSSQYQTLATAQSNKSQAIQVTSEGRYVVQCRICPPPTAQYKYCNDPTWGWDSTQTVTDNT